MGSKKQPVFSELRFFFGIPLFLATVLVLFSGVGNEIRLITGHPYYLEGCCDKGFAIFRFVVGILMLALVIYVIFQPRNKRVGWLLIFPFLVTTCIASSQIERTADNNLSYRSVYENLEYRFSNALCLWMKRYGRLPENQAEVQMAMEEYAKGRDDDPLLLSPFAHDGKRIPYEFVYVRNASGPYLSEPPVDRPGVVYFAISEDLEQFWLTATVLKRYAKVGYDTFYFEHVAEGEKPVECNGSGT